MNSPKIAVIGCGYWGKNLVRNFYQLGALAAICDPIESVAKKFADLYQVPAKSWEGILHDATIQGVVLSVPVPLHARLCCEALQARKDVYVEKPLAGSEEEGEHIQRTLEAFPQVFMVGHLFQYHPAVNKIAELLSKHVIGKLKYVRSHRWNLGKIRSEENVLWSLAPHDFSTILRFIPSKLRSLSAYGQYCFQDSIADRVDVQMVFEPDIHAEVSVSWVHPFKERKLVLGGTEGMLVWDDTLSNNECLKLYRHVYSRKGKAIVVEKAEPEPIVLSTIEPLQAECQHFLECIQTRKTPRTDIREGMAVVHLLQQAQMSLDHHCHE